MNKKKNTVTYIQRLYAVALLSLIEASIITNAAKM